jgi:hypothetical protein
MKFRLWLENNENYYFVKYWEFVPVKHPDPSLQDISQIIGDLAPGEVKTFESDSWDELAEWLLQLAKKGKFGAIVEYIQDDESGESKLSIENGNVYLHTPFGKEILNRMSDGSYKFA